MDKVTKVTYLEHSGFLVQTNQCAIIFDYYTGNIPPLPADTPVYVFSSHNHHDHFNPDIFKLRETYPQITYILSDDVKCREKGASIHFVAPDKTVVFPHFELKTTGSTDEGVSFLLRQSDSQANGQSDGSGSGQTNGQSNGQAIYHAGDLNWWTWIGEETESQAREMEGRFKKEVAKLKPYPIDIAFLPLDPRQQERFYWGFDYFMRSLDIALAFPMHFWKKDSIIDQLKAAEYSAGYRDRVGALRSNGDSWQ